MTYLSIFYPSYLMDEGYDDKIEKIVGDTSDTGMGFGYRDMLFYNISSSKVAKIKKAIRKLDKRIEVRFNCGYEY